MARTPTPKALPTAHDLEVVDAQIRRSARRLDVFRAIDVADQGTTLLRQSRRLQKNLLKDLNNTELTALLNFLDPDKATDLLRQLPDNRSKHVTAQLSSQLREKVEFLLRFHPRTAAGMMDLDYILVEPKDTFGNIAEQIEDHEKQTGRYPIVLCMDKGHFVGEVPVQVLALKPPSTKAGEWSKHLTAIHYNDDERSVVSTFIHHPHSRIVVLDDDKSVLGIIHSDDVLALVDKRNMRDLFQFAGVSHEEDALDSAWSKFRNRYIWLVINLGTAFLAASVVGAFEDTIAKFTLLAVYMPIVAGMGGNAGTQTMAIAVRGIVMKEVDLFHGWKFVRREAMAGLFNGLLNGVIVGAVAVIFNKSPELGLVLALAMVANLIIAGFFGAIIPLIMKALGKDPASSATIFITTCTDVGGFFVFLSLAKALL